MKSAALELGPHKITVNAVVPGLIDTPLTRHQERYAQVLQDGGRTPTGSDEEAAKKILAAKFPPGVPWIDPADVAPVVVFLASDAARMVSGAASMSPQATAPAIPRRCADGDRCQTLNIRRLKTPARLRHTTVHEEQQRKAVALALVAGVVDAYGVILITPTCHT